MQPRNKNYFSYKSCLFFFLHNKKQKESSLIIIEVTMSIFSPMILKTDCLNRNISDFYVLCG